MARKPPEENGVLPGMEPEGTTPRPRVRVSNPRPPAARLRIAVRVVISALVLVAGLYGFHRTEQYLIRDPRFALVEPEGTEGTVGLKIQGGPHVSRRAVQQVFRDDVGRSVYTLPFEDRATSLRTLDWVRRASVARVWPNLVLVQITERSPVAFVTLGASRFGLIDEEGVILPPVADRFHLPVLKGVRSSDPVPERRDRVRRMLRMMRELGDTASQISEVDVSDAANLKVSQPYEGRMVKLHLGDQNFGVRYRNFTAHYREIREKLPNAGTLDLRMEDRITVVDE